MSIEPRPGLLDQLRSIPLFSGLSDYALIRVAEAVSEVEAEPGHVLIQPGVEGSGMFVLEEGTVIVEVGDQLIEQGSGEFFGELALLAPGIRRTARVRAKTRVRCLAINRQDFAALLEKEPAIGVAMLPVLARRLADTDAAMRPA